MAITINKRAKRQIRQLYSASTRSNLHTDMSTKSRLDALVDIIHSTPLSQITIPNGTVIKEWMNKGYTVLCTTYCFIRKSYGIKAKQIQTARDKQRVWYFATIREGNMLYIVDAVIAIFLLCTKIPISLG